MIASMAGVALGNQFSGSNSNKPPIADTNVTPEATGSALTWPDGPALTIDEGKPYVATMRTNKGDIKVELLPDAPKTANSFAFLAGNGFFDGDIFFYVDKQLGAVAGDPTCRVSSDQTCSGLGGPGYTLPLENTSASHDQWMVVAPFLSEGEGQIHGSQFRVLYGPDARLNGKETVFGKVVQGQDILQALSDNDCVGVEAKTCSGDGGVVIQKVTVQPA
ncbi:MAG: peptidylprolyl isomerase [Chloroflexi bacterium]|nr:MAG: peptidylprolyl isomerase [Chloroflexota bacterium]